MRTPEQYQPLQVTTRVASQPTYTADAFGAGAYRQIQAAGDAGIKIAANMAEKQDDIDKTTARDTINKLLPTIDKNFIDTQTTFSGVKATEQGYQDFEKKSRQAIDEAIKDLPAGAREYVSLEMANRNRDYALKWNDYSANQLQTAKVNSLKAENDRLTTEIAGGNDVDYVWASPLGADGKPTIRLPKDKLIIQNLKSIYPNQTEETYQSLAANEIGKAYLARAQTLAQSSAIEAQKFIAANAERLNNFDPLKTAELSARVNEVADKEIKAAKVQQIVATAKSDQDAMFQAQASGDKDLIESVQKEIDFRKKQAEYTNGSNLLDAVNVVSAGSNIPAGQPIEVTRSLEVLADRKRLNSVGSVERNNQLLAIADSAGWKNLPQFIQENRNDLGADAVQAALITYARRQRGEDITADIAKRDGYRGALGILIKGKNPDEQIRMEKGLQQALNAAERQKGAELSELEMKNIAYKMTLNTGSSQWNSWFGRGVNDGKDAWQVVGDKSRTFGASEVDKLLKVRGSNIDNFIEAKFKTDLQKDPNAKRLTKDKAYEYLGKILLNSDYIPENAAL